MKEAAIEHVSGTGPGTTRVVTTMPGVITEYDVTMVADYDPENLKPSVLTNPALGHTATQGGVEVDANIWDN